MYKFKEIILKSTKLALGSLISLMIANKLGLSYAPSAAVITILSVLDTKKATFYVAGKRVVAFILAIIIAFISFSILDFTIIAFILFVFFFSGLCYFLNIEQGIPMNTVLITHFWLEKSMGIELIKNESALFIIGITCGILVNLYMTKNLKLVFKNKKNIDLQLKDLIYDISILLENPKKEENIEYKIFLLKSELKESLKIAYNNEDNHLTQDMGYFIEYLYMRKRQLKTLLSIYKSIKLLSMVPKQAKEIADFIKNIPPNYKEFNNASNLYENLLKIKNDMKKEDLPKTREEFENRSILFHILYLLEEFLKIKKDFIETLEEDTINKFRKDFP